MIFRLLLIGFLSTGLAFAQRGGGGGGGASSGAPNLVLPLIDRMGTTCNLSKDQKKQFKTILDAASKSAAPLRKQIPLSRVQIGAAVQSGKSADEIKKLVEANGLMRAQMAEMEYKAYGELYRILDADQRKASGQRLFSMTSGILMKNKWNE